MTDVKIFDGRECVPSALKKFGFKKQGEAYRYEKSILDGQFTIKVTVSDRVTCDVYDELAEDNYYLHLVEEASGGFVGQIRAEYEGLLGNILKTCFKPAFVFGDAGKEAVTYAKSKYRSDLEFLWKDDAKDAVLRRKDNKKWYAVFMCVQRKKIGLEGDGEIPIVDLRAPKEEITRLVDGVNYFKAWHMNKQNWITVPLDGRINAEVVCWLIDMSYDLAKKK